MLATATLQHNLAALQAQLATLQQENSALTRDRSLKENYIQLKDQQFRVMQRRLEELEGSVAQWKDRWLQQVNAQQATSSSSADDTRGDDAAGAQAADRLEDAKWTPWKCKPGAASKAKALAQAAAKLEKLSQTDRNKLKPLLDALEQSGGASAVQDLVFADVSEELSRILLLYLLPALLDAVDGAQQLQCFSRTYRKQTMDFRVCTASAATAEAAGEEPAVSTPAATAVDKLPLPASAEPSGNSSALAAQAAPETEETEAPHLFDYVELDRRGVARTPVPHGPRELHATKAMFISRPLSGSAAARAAISPLDKLGDKPLEKASRRYTLTPKRTGPTFAVETTRTHTMTMGALPSPAQSPSSMGVLPLGSDGEVIPMPPREKEAKDGKIKKIVGSVFDRLSRHKSQQSLGSTSAASSTQASPVPLAAPAGSSEGAGDEDDSICDGCGRGPLVGAKWVCRTCRLLAGEEYELCEKCYGQGLHGKEHEDALFARVEAIVVRKCPRLSSETELLHLLRVGICKANLKKFSFCLTWIADLLQCNRTTDLRARALEIAHIPPTVRSEFARLLRELLTRYRPDIELRTEWEPAAGAQHSTIVPGTPAPDELDTLRIWVKDAPLATPASTGTTSIGTPSLG